ncbi:hypothetical protein B0H17DRAFT_1069500 [Mycena rosella]|uniref:Uncharacterized protein n=1 Tax=Mycena rosella TaxID=1033263 RepID=A0AAD7DBM0_MYCRO|nr:hypothetical protein B0H17DRAFT_1069500 [Mycena rosella]
MATPALSLFQISTSTAVSMRPYRRKRHNFKQATPFLSFALSDTAYLFFLRPPHIFHFHHQTRL